MASFATSLMSTACASVVLGGLLTAPASAAPPETAPATLVNAIDAIETAANAQDIEQLMAFYDDSFEGADGFTREQYQATLSEFWQQYDSLTYDVELVSWDMAGTELVAETLTTVTGTQMSAGRTMALTAEVRSRQYYINGQITSQEILAEQTRLASGDMPPEVNIQLPETVAPGEDFTFDAIVEEPLGDRLLLGLALDEGVTVEDFLTPRPIDLEALSAGGLFKVGKAPTKPDQRWISSILVRDDGIVVDTRRLRVED